MCSKGYLRLPSQHQYSYSFNKNTICGTDRMDTHHSNPFSRMALQRSISLGSPLQERSIRDNHCHNSGTQSYGDCDDIIPQQCDFSKIHPRNHNAALTIVLKQLEHYMESRNICRYFMLRRCSAQKCDHVHDANFRETFMETLFGDAWRGFWNSSSQDLSGRFLSKNNPTTGAQTDRALETLEYSLTGNQNKGDMISFDPPKTLNVSAGLYIPPSSRATPLYARVSTEMEDEKSEVQPNAGSENRQQRSVAESGSPFFPHRRRREKLYRVRHRMNLWGRAAWKKTAITKQRKIQDESEVALEHAD